MRRRVVNEIGLFLALGDRVDQALIRLSPTIFDPAYSYRRRALSLDRGDKLISLSAACYHTAMPVGYRPPVSDGGSVRLGSLKLLLQASTNLVDTAIKK